MSEYAVIRRYSLILEKLEHRHFPSIHDLKSYLHKQGFEISKRTLQRDIEHLRMDFGVEVSYDNYKKGYYLNEANSLNLDSFFRFLEISTTANILSDTLKDSKDAMDYLSFETEGNLKGINNLERLLKAVKNNREVTFTYYRFDQDKHYPVTLRPQLLKEYEYRWYVIGPIMPAGEIRIFGLDRITDLKVKDKIFDEPDREQVKSLFDHVVGLNYSEHDITEITILADNIQGKYLKTLPLHHTQEIVEENEEGLLLKVKLRPNYEFKQRILMFGSNVEIKKPKWFRAEIKKSLEESLAKYR